MALSGVALSLAAVLALTVATTGAYFTDNNGGQITGNLATIQVTTSGGTGADGLDFSFDNMLPGVDKVASIHVQNTGTVSEDVYLAFKNDNFAWSAVNTYGAYGIFTVDGVIYDNLNNQYPWGTDSSGQVMSSNPASACYLVPRPAQIKYLPHVIFLGTLGPTASKDFDIKFHWHACMTGGQGGQVWGESDTPPAVTPAALQFVIAAFQPGVNVADPFNGSGKILPLDLSTRGAYSYQ